MKKSFKTQMKKSISLFLAVLMILSCWVWVAPEKASADYKTGQYYVKITAYVADYSKNGSGALYLSYIPNNGTGTSTGLKKVADLNSGFVGESTHKTTITLFKGYIDGFPDAARIDAQTNAAFFSDWSKLRLENFQVFVGKDENSCTTAVTNADSAESSKDASPENKSISIPVYKLDGVDPVISSATTPKAQSKTIPEVNSASVVKTDEFLPEYWDQYGVKWIAPTAPTYIIARSATGTQDEANEENGFSFVVNETTGKVHTKITAKMQEGFALSGTDSNPKNYYLIATVTNSVGIEVKAIQTITVTYPTYTVTVKPNGGSMPMSDGSKSTEIWTNTGVYGKDKDVYPMVDASRPIERTGYAFLGLWTVPQPTEKEGDYDATVNAYEADFVVPVSSKDFENYCNQVKDTDGNNYVTVGNKTYYKAGKLWETATSRKVSGNETYYAWYVAEDIPVKFYDIDGKYLGTVTYKYNMKLKDKLAPTPTHEIYNAGAFTYSEFKGTWSNINGTEVSPDFVFGSDGLYAYTLTPKYTKKEYKNSYDVTFVKPDGTKVKNPYEYRHILSGAEIVTSVDMPEVLSKDLAYSYVFKGWTTQTPSSGNYIVVDNDDTVVLINEDWTVRNDVVYYPVFERTIKSYAVIFYYRDTTGAIVNKTANIKYGSLFTTPEGINETYAKEGKSYTLLSWEYEASENNYVNMGFDESIVFNADNVNITDKNIAGGTPITFTSIYDNGTYKPYDIVFRYKGAEGKEYKVLEGVTHGEAISQEIITRVEGAVPEAYDDGEALYTFANSWKVVEGTASKELYTTAELVGFKPTSNVVFEAVYGTGVPFYTVTYIDGAAQYSERILQGKNVPAWMLSNGQQYIPKDYETPTGVYEFVGWFDEKQTDEDCKVTNGNEYTTESTVSGNLTLYPQYIYEAYKYEIKFVGFDGEVLASGEFAVEESFKAIHDEAEAKAKARPADKTYTYTFIGWDHSAGNFECDGKAITFTARYRSNYIYYKANWFSSEDAVSDTPIAVTQHTYKSSVYNPSVDLEVPANKVFDGWYYKVNGQEKAFERGLIIEGDMNFYAKYKDAPKTFTVTAVVDGTSTKYNVAEGGNAGAIVAPEYIYVGAYIEDEETKNGHKKFAGWFADETYETAYDIKSEVTGNITVYAKYVTEEHTFIIDEIISDPTYYTKGEVVKYCVCDKVQTTIPVEIPELTDTVVPVGTIQLGALKWSSTDETGAAATDNDEVSIFANADTDIIITVNDRGDVSEDYNPGGIGKGIKIIRAFVSKGVYGQGTTEGQIAGIKTVYTDDTEDLNNVANYVVRLGSYEGLENGETYIVYYYVQDKAGNVLNSKVRTAKFVYDTSAPVFEITGYNNGASIPTYCGSATVTGIEANATVTVNGKEVTVQNGTFVIDEANNYIITVTDRAGNKTSKKIKVVEGHDTIETTVKSTCTTDGYRKVVCTVCGTEIESETYVSTGHVIKPSIVPATCDEDGYILNTCEICGFTEIIKEENGELIDPKLGHVYPVNDAGDIVYTVVTEATCVSEGLKVANCTYCGGGTLSEVIPVDEANGHNYGSIKTLKPTCTEAGMTYQRCKYCYHLLTGETIPATGHQETYTSISPATCKTEGSEVKFCKKCGVEVSSTVLPVTDKHVYYVAEIKEPSGTEEGYIKYVCQVCKHSYQETISKLETFDAVFVAEDGETVITQVIDEVIGTTITEDVLKGENGASLIPEKASDNEYDYAFSGWTDADGKTVKLPFEITADITLKATYKATRRIYTHNFLVPTKWTTTLSTEENSKVQYGDSIIGYYGDVNKKPNTIPKFTDADPETDKRLKAQYTFTFLGWSIDGSANNIVEDFTKYPMTGDATFTAVFKAELKEYNVIFSKKNGDFLWSTKVKAGETVKYGGENPAYYDDNYHYSFNLTDGINDEWLHGTANYGYDANIGPIYADTKLVANYVKAEHTFTTVEAESWAPTCYSEGKLTEMCECGYIKVTTHSKLEHDFNGVTPDADGNLVCKNPGCDYSIPAETKFVTITFVVDGVSREVQVAEGETYTFTAPNKESSVSHEYPFAAWFKNNAEYSKSQTITVTAGSADETYVATYGETIRKYRVTYFDENHNVFIDKNGKACTGLYEYGSIIPAKPEKVPSKAYDRDNHYTFIGWTVTLGSTASGRVEGDIEIYETYETIPHNFVEKTLDATCTEVGGKKNVCECGYSYTVGSAIPMIPHTVGKVLEKTEATIYNDGVYRYICAVCGEEQKEVVPMLANTNIAIRVYDGEGNKAAYVTVKIYYSVVKDGVTSLVEYKTKTGYSYLTNAEGFVNVVVPAEYKGWRASIYYDGGSYSGELQTGGVENIFGGPKVEEPDSDCTCTCHKGRRPGDGLFAKLVGNVFRFFQKLLNIFGAKPCCADPER